MSQAEQQKQATSVAPEDRRALVAVDLGAESCRVSLLRWIDGVPQIELVHRFANGPVERDGSLRWPIEQLVSGVEEGLRKAAAIATEGVRSIAVDGWAVDYVRLGADDRPVAAPFCYRDERTVEAERVLHERISAERLREITGLQLQRINTLYQQVADRLASAPAGRPWVNLPEYLLHRWGAPAVAEFTNATHTEMVDHEQRAWSKEILRAAGIEESSMPRLVPAGTRLGRLRGELAKLPAFAETELIAPACHDTASAIAGIAAEGENDWGYISSGTWSLVGTLLPSACATEAAHLDGFTNLGAVGGSICFHASVNGMWLLKQCMDAWAEQGSTWDVAELVSEAEQSAAPVALLDVDDPDLLLMGDMPARIRAQFERRGLVAPDTSAANAPAVACLIFHSLAERYRAAFEALQGHCGKTLRRIFVVGGGSRNEFLRRLTQEKTGLPVLSGLAESSTTGNFAVQLAAFESDPAAADFGARVHNWAARLQA